ncbi:MAG: hypothetical protein IPG98_12070 [Burkholderiales bacterium]|nr:hypothetical protein [Burkholderiales bacterium]MBK8664976.1 hypothetical protein [Burkholderiales bacterium]
MRASRTEIGKDEQALRDIAQSVTVTTEKLMQDRTCCGRCEDCARDRVAQCGAGRSPPCTPPS